MSNYPTSPLEQVGGMAYFPRMLDKIRKLARAELSSEYHANLGHAHKADGVCANFLRVSFEKLRERVLAGGSDEEILEWCYEIGRRLNQGDLIVWNGFVSKLGWNDFASERLAELKKENGVEHRDDIQTIPQMMDYEEKRSS